MLPTPAGLATQPDLELLMLGFNRLRGPLPERWDAPALLRLDLQRNNFTGGRGGGGKTGGWLPS